MSTAFEKADDILAGYDYDADEYRRPRGTEDWELVALEDALGGYEWDKLGVFYSPSARRYFWLARRGCSCNTYRDDAKSVSSFRDGDREAALRAVIAWRDEADYLTERRSYPAGKIAAAVWGHRP